MDTQKKSDIVVKKGKKWVSPFIISITALLVIVTVVIICFTINSSSKATELQEQLDLGNKYLSELDYEQAIVAYEAAIEIDPMSVEAYLGLASVYEAQGNYDKALEVLQQGYDATGDKRIADKIDEIHAWQEQEISEENMETSENAEPDWLINGVPESNILDVADFKFDGIYIADFTSTMLLEMYGEYDNSYTIDEFKSDNYHLNDELDQNAEYISAREQGNWDMFWEIEREFWNAKISESGLYKLDSAYYIESDGIHDQYEMSRGDSPYSNWCLTARTFPSGRQEIVVSGQNAPIGYGDIYFGDDFDTVMSKIGFTKEQTEWVKENFYKTDDYDVNNIWRCRADENGMISFDEVCYTTGGNGIDISYHISFIPHGADSDSRDIVFNFDENYKLYSCTSYLSEYDL